MFFDLGDSCVGSIYRAINIELFSGGFSITPENIELMLEKWGEEEVLRYFQPLDGFFPISIWFDSELNLCLEDFDGYSISWSKEEFINYTSNV